MNTSFYHSSTVLYMAFVLLSSQMLVAQNPSALDAADGAPGNVVSVDSEGDVVISGRDNDGVDAALKITSGSQSLLIDGNEIDGDTGIFLNNNLTTNVSLVNGGGNVGIGTDNPQSRLVVTNHGYVGSSNWALTVDSETSDSSSGILNLRDSTGASVLYARGDGRVGIGTTSPQSSLSVAGVIESTSGGIQFPDGSVQTSAVGDIYSLDAVDGHPDNVVYVESSGTVLISEDVEFEKNLKIGVNDYEMHSVSMGGSGGGRILLDTYPQGDAWLELLGGNPSKKAVTIRSSTSGRGVVATDELNVRDIIQLEPRLDPPANPSPGTIYFDSDGGVLCIYNGVSWDQVGSGTCS